MNPIDEYIMTCPEEHREKLSKLKEIIESVDLTMEQKLSWGMPTFKKKKFIIHFALAKKHIGLYAGSEAVEFFKEELKNYYTNKGTIRLPLNEELNVKLIQDIVRWNIEEDNKL